MSLADRWITLFNKPIPNVILRLVVLFGGFLSMAMSIALMRTTGLGNSPISCIPATLSYLVPLTLGTITFIMNTCFLIVQAILLRRDFNPVQLLQIPFTFVFALMIDQLLPFCETLPMQYYPEQLGVEHPGLLPTCHGSVPAGQGKLYHPAWRRHCSCHRQSGEKALP